MQRRVALWISGTFHTSPLVGIKAILGLIPIHFHLKKLYRRFHFCGFSLPTNHIIKLIIDTKNSNKCESHHLSLNNLTPKQWTNIKELSVNMDNRYNKFISSFSLFNEEFSSGNRLTDMFPKQFSFHPIDSKSTHDVKNHLNKLDNIIL